ncbi:hypothetical protein D3C72_137570 [compost metagenome]
MDLSSVPAYQKPPIQAEVRIADELPYSIEKPTAPQKERDQAESKRQSKRADIAPGQMIARKSDGGKRGIRQLRQESAAEMAQPFTGIQKSGKTWNVPEIRNPDDAQGKFDPYAFMPRMVFAGNEDSFPILPDFDRDGKNTTDVAAYRHGVIGGSQPLHGSVSVAQKGEFTVLTYSQYYVDNKFTNYHTTDSSTMAVYLKPGKNGKLEPEYLYTSWHYGATMTPWKDLAKDDAGRPVVLVERSSHALHPYGKDETVPSKGLQIAGDGSASLNGKALPNRMELVSPQESFKNVSVLDLGKSRDQDVMKFYFERYPERMNPVHPVLFDKVYPEQKSLTPVEQLLTKAKELLKRLFG